MTTAKSKCFSFLRLAYFWAILIVNILSLSPSYAQTPSDFLTLSSTLTLRGGYFRSNYNFTQSVEIAKEKMLI